MSVPALWPHQQLTLRMLQRVSNDRPPCWLLDLSDPGTGKTAAHITAFADRRRAGGGRALVVCTKSIIEAVWGREFRTFAPDMFVSYAYAGKQRKAAFDEMTDAVIVNADGVKDIEPAWLKGFDTLIIDEITYFKHGTSQRSEAMRRLSERFDYRVGLTGTPNPNTITELWHQVLLLDGGKTFGTSFYRFRNQFCTPIEGPFAVEWQDKPNAERLAMYMLSGHVVRHAFEAVMDVPPNYTRTVDYQLPDKLLDRYEQLERHTVLQLRSGEMNPVSAGDLRNKLLQLASGAVYTGEGRYEVFDSARYDLIADLITERRHSVTFYIWKHQRDELSKILTKRKIAHATLDGSSSDRERAEMVEAYQAGRYQTLLLHPQTGAHGLTLTKGVATIWCSPVYQPDFLKQGKHRIYRGSQTEKTENLLIQASGTVEELVYDRLGGKQRRMVSFLQLVEEAQALREAHRGANN